MGSATFISVYLSRCSQKYMLYSTYLIGKGGGVILKTLCLAVFIFKTNTSVCLPQETTYPSRHFCKFLVDSFEDADIFGLSSMSYIDIGWV